MTIDFISLIIGAVLWELIQVYFNCYVVPKFKHTRDRRKQEKMDREPQQEEGDYKGTGIGFNCKLENESK